MPSKTSVNTTSASSLAAIQWAAVAPTFPAPTIVTFLRIKFLPEILELQSTAGGLAPVHHIFNQASGKFTCLYFGRSGHETLQIIGDLFLLYGELHGSLNQARRFIPAE